MGGSVQLWAVPVSQVENIKPGTLSLVSADDVVAIYTTPETISVSADDHESRAGLHYPIEITASVPSVNAETDRELEDMRGKRFIVVLLDSNGNHVVHGSLVAPMKFTYMQKKGTDTSDFNHYALRWKCNSVHPPIIVDDPFRS